MTPAQFITIRKEAGLSLGQLSDIIRVHPRTIRRYEDGSIPISGPVSVLMELLQEGVFSDRSNKQLAVCRECDSVYIGHLNLKKEVK